MAKVTFVNEDRTVEVEPGRRISDVAAELGIAVCREEFAGIAFGNWTVWVKGADGCVSPPGLVERMLGVRGWKRLANRTRILGDVMVYTQGGIGDRLRSPRPVTAPPSPAKNPEERKKGIDAAGDAAFPYGNPGAVGKGERPAVARSTAKPKVAKGGKAAAAAAEPEEDEESEADE